MNAPLEMDALLKNILENFSCPIGCIGLFMADLLYSFQCFYREPDQSRGWMQALCTAGDVSGVDITMVTFDDNIVMSGPTKRMLQLLADKPGQELFGPFEATDTNFLTMKIGPEFRHIKGEHNLIADALSRLDLDDSSEEYKLEKPTDLCMAAIISRTEIINDELSPLDGFEMAEAFGIKSKKKTKYEDYEFPMQISYIKKCKIKTNR
jgi:hypothetical protein